MDDNRNPPHTSSDVDVQQSSPDHASTSNPNNLTSTNTDINNNKKKKNKKPTAVVQKVPFYKLFVFADKFDFTLMAVGSIAAVCNGLTQPLMTLLFGQVINSFGSSDSEHVVHQVSKVSLKFFYLAFYACIVCFLQVSCWMVTGERQAARIRSLYLKAILRQDVAFFDTETTTGEVIGRLSGDTVLIQNAMGEKVGKFIQLMATFVGGFAIAFIQGWHLAIVLLSSIPALVVIGATMGLIMTKMSSRAQTTYAEAGNVVEQTIGAIRTVASFTGETEAITKYNTKLNVAYRSTVQQGLASGLGLGALLTIIFSTYSLAVWYGSKLIINGEYNGGQVINVIIAMLAGGTSLGQTSPSLNAFAAGQAAAYKMFETIKRKPKIDTSSMEGTELAEVKGEIELRNVYFRYPARSDLEIFSGFSLHIPNGITVALVGQSGSGKSTVISLIERFYDPDAGEVLIDGINLKALKLSWFRQKVGLVSQEPNLFTTTIRENIKYGKEEATEEEILAAMERANASKFIDKLPLGLDTMVGEHGTQLSGGQKQRIAIARAILKNPKILLLDEATSALDVESEHIVQEALDRIMADRTTVVVAHRLTTIKDADIIAVVRQGKIIEQGTHKELIQNASSAYSQLVQLQEGDKDHGPTPIDSADLVNISTSMRRSMSIGSSSGRRSLSINFGIPGSVFIHETNEDEHEINDDNGENTSNNKKSYESSNMKRKKVSLARLFTLNKPEVPILLLGTAAASVHGVIFPISGLLLSTTIKIFYEPLEYLSKDSRFWALVYLCLAASCLAAIPGQNFFFGIAGGRLVRRVRLLTFQKLVHQEIGWFDDPKHSSGAIGARLSTDASNVRGLVGDQLALVVQNVATVTAGLVIAFTANYILALIVLAVAPFMLLQGYFQARFMMGFSADAKVMYEEASQIANDAVGSIRTIISYCAEKKVMNLYDAKCEEPVKHVVRLAFVSGAGIGFSLFALYCTNAFCFYIGAVLIHHNKASFGEFFKVFFAVTITARGLSESSSLAIDRNRAKDSTASIFDILDRKSMIDSSNDEGITLTNVEGDIVLEHVSFKYPTRPDIQIFKDLCLNIPSGKTVALVGESGSGKSTIISLIERFYDPIEGKVLLDRVEINKLKISWLRRQMGLVSQEPILFNDTIRANIGYGRQGKETVLEEEIIRAAKSSNAHNFISSLPEGYDTNVGERGNQLSGGQKQRIAIARAILRDPKILLLDEATSALDAESEQVVQEALDQVMVNRTTVMVAHRLSTVRNADVIAVVKNGVVAEQGKHDELMVIPEGAYASLVALQSRAAVDDVDGHK